MARKGRKLPAVDGGRPATTAARGETSSGRAAIAFAFVGPDSAASERDGYGFAAGGQPAPVGSPAAARIRTKGSGRSRSSISV